MNPSQHTQAARSVTRRDFLNGIAISTLAGWSAGVAPRHAAAIAPSNSDRRWGGNDREAYEAGHALRDGAFAEVAGAQDSGEHFDVAIVGGGISGLTAAVALDRLAGGKLKVLGLENHALPGGVAQTDLFEVGGKRLLAPQGSIVSQVPTPGLATSDGAMALLDDVWPDAAAYEVPHMDRGFGVVRQDTRSGKARLYKTLMDAPIPKDVQDGYFALLGESAALYDATDWREKLASLDTQSFKQYVASRGWSSAVYDWMVPELANFYGIPDQVSAAAVWRQYGGGPPSLRSFPGGNAAVASALARALWPQALAQQRRDSPLPYAELHRKNQASAPTVNSLRLGATAVAVQHLGPPDSAKAVSVTYYQNGKLIKVLANAAIMAGGAFVTRHVVRDLPPDKQAALARFIYAPIVWANVALRNSAALDSADPPFMTVLSGRRASLLVAYDKMNQAGGSADRDPARPTAVGLSIPYFYPGEPARAQAAKGRREILDAPFDSFEAAIRNDLSAILGPYGFDHEQDIAAISVSRWGHGYLLPVPGFLTGAARRLAAEPVGRIAYAHTDLDGFCHITGAVGEGYRAAEDALRILGYR